MNRVYTDRLVLVSGDEGVRWERQASNGRIRAGGTDHSKWYKRKASMMANLRTENPKWWQIPVIDKTGVGVDATRHATDKAPPGYNTRKPSAARL